MVPMNPDKFLETKIEGIGRRLLALAREGDREFRKRHAWESSVLEWCMSDPEIKTRIFRFIDVFPALRTSKAVLAHLREYFPPSQRRLPAAIRTGLLLAHPGVLTRKMVHEAARFIYLRIAALFVAAPGEKEALRVVDEFECEGVLCSLDLLGERTLAESEAETYFRRYRNLIGALGARNSGLEMQNVSVKISALDPRFDPIDPEGTSFRVRKRLRELARLARKGNVFLHIDMEEYQDRDLTLKIIRDLTSEEEFGTGLALGIVVQSYLRDAERSLENILSWARTLAHPLTIRLVRGAYWDQELMKARENHWPVPVFTRKNETDAMFERLARRILEQSPRVRLACATHNIRSIAFVAALAESRRLDRKDYEFQLLYGMGHALSYALRKMDFRPRIYTPIGDPVWGMAYLVRRLLENVSAQSFVRRGIREKADDRDLLAAPVESPRPEEGAAGKTAPADVRFEPLPPLRFFDEKDRLKFMKSLDHAPSALGATLPVVIGSRPRNKSEFIQTVSPVDGRTMITRASKADEADAIEAIEAAESRLKPWSRTAASERAACLRRAARWMTGHRFELAALTVYEVGKTWREADAEVKEAADLMNFYARAAETLGDQATECLDQEVNFLRPRPRGVSVIIAPWNFPLAILTGMSAASLAAGNPVVLKPAEQSLLCGWNVFQAYLAGGVPEGAVNFLPGYGHEIGPALVKDPRTALIAFTGSKDVGLGILSLAQERTPGQKHVKKVIAEMGGKNAAILDETADFDTALPAILESAFGYAGQKCSALSRLIVLDSVYADFTGRLREAAASYTVGDPRQGASRMGPLIDKSALERVQSYREEGKKNGRVLFEGPAPDSPGFYAAPLILDELPRDSRLLREEIFGPVLAVIRARNFEQALEEANRTEYALTAGIFSRTPSRIEKAKQEIEAGNLYVNRPLTGAIVGRQPFGGYRLSGTGTKAGSAAYLKEFFLEQTVSENLSRHGFAPLDDSSQS
jgi:RHH-type proline utilization regulon transcriptional repressor/proline dehydrogenase/delta 1-pyrroline-5-carboxylate dehydrogenase